MKRREFFKNLGGSLFLSFLPVQLKAQQSDQGTHVLTAGNTDLDQDLKFLNRSAADWPTEPKGYRSSFYKKIFRLKDLHPSQEQCTFSVQPLDDDLNEIGEEFDCAFSILRKKDKFIFSSADQNYFLLWKPKFGLYILHDKNRSRVVEHCDPLDGNQSRYLSDNRVVVQLGRSGAFYSHWVRWSYWMNGGPQSPLDGFEGFAEESLILDASDNRDKKVAAGLDWFLKSIPFGLPALKLLAKTSPPKAVSLLDKLIPKVFGWMIGPTQLAERGKLVLSDCPYRKRLGTQVCESTCGHSISKYFTYQVGVPMRFDPTVDGYTKCHILIGKDQVLTKS